MIVARHPTPIRPKTGTGEPVPVASALPQKSPLLLTTFGAPQVACIEPVEMPASSQSSRLRIEHIKTPSTDLSPVTFHFSLLTSFKIPSLFHRPLGCVLVELHRLLDRCLTGYHAGHVLPHAGT
jgi:hypothetical protein